MAAAGPASAAILEINSEGILTGARNIVIGGSFYDVAFVEGTCAEVFGNCENSPFLFLTLASAQQASVALLSQVFLDVPSLGFFDSQPTLTRGCETSPTFCEALTPYEYLLHDPLVFGQTSIRVRGARNNGLGLADEVFPEDVVFSFFIENDTRTNPLITWAVWSPIPEPSSFALLSTSLVVLGWWRRRQRFVERRNRN
jgi:hypothetical protein